MEIRVERDEYTYTVTVGNKPIITTWVRSELQLKRWIQEVQVIYGKRNRQNIVVGLCADRSLNYSNSPFRIFNNNKGSRKDDPYELLQLCIGRHCLLYQFFSDTPKVLRDFFYDRRTMVVGVGIEKTAAKLEKENGILIRTRMELRDLAKEADEKGLQEEGLDFSRYDLQRLAMAVLGEEEGKFEKPRKIKWYATQQPWKFLSDDMVKYATVEAFLAYEMGSKLLR